MQKVILEITMSLDGFIAGPSISKTEPMGTDGQRLHDWLFKKKTAADDALIKEIVDTSGAVIVGSRTYTTAINDAWGGESPFEVPAFVVCHAVPTEKVKGFEYISDGITSALDKAKAAAGNKNIGVMGGANIMQQYLQQNLFDEMHIHIAPVLFFKGTRLFDCFEREYIGLKKIKVIDTPGATHLYYEVE